MKSCLTTFRSFCHTYYDEVYEAVYDSTDQYDHVMDLYNNGLDRMWRDEQDFFKSGGRAGSTPRYGLPQELLELYDSVFDYLERRGIPWKLISANLEDLGKTYGIKVPYSPTVESYLEDIFEAAPQNNTAFNYVEAYGMEESYRGKRGSTGPRIELIVWVLMPDEDEFIEPQYL